MRWLVPRLPEFARAHPEVTINLSTRLQKFNFASEGIDAAIHFGDADWPGTQALRLMQEQVLPVAAPDLLGNLLAGLASGTLPEPGGAGPAAAFAYRHPPRGLAHLVCPP